MTCSNRREALLDLSLGLLAPAAARALEAHAAGCQACGEELRSLRAARQAMGTLPVMPAPVHGEGLLLAAARQEADRLRERRPAWRRPWLAGGTLGLAGAAALVLVLVQSHGEPRLTDGPAPAEADRAAGSEPPRAAAPAASAELRADALAEAPLAVRAEQKQERAKAATEVMKRRAVIGVASNGPGAGPSPASNRASVAAPVDEAAPAAPPVAADAMAVASAPPAPAPVPTAKRARAAGAEPKRFAADEERGVAAAAPAPSPVAMAGRVAPAEAGEGKGSAAGCRMESRRRFDRDEAGRVMARHRAGRYPDPGGGDWPLTIDEWFAPGGRLRSAQVRIGERLITVSEMDVAAGRLEPWPGVVLAADAAEAESASPRCEP